MGAVDDQSESSHDVVQQGAGMDPGGVNETAGTPGGSVGEGIGPLGGDILDQASPLRDVQDLDPAADAEDRQITFERLPHQAEIRGFLGGVEQLDSGAPALVVPAGIEIDAAAEEEAVQRIEGARRRQSGGNVRQENGDTASRARRLDVFLGQLVVFPLPARNPFTRDPDAGF